jgi:hypothetical protein
VAEPTAIPLFLGASIKSQVGSHGPSKPVAATGWSTLSSIGVVRPGWIPKILLAHKGENVRRDVCLLSGFICYPAYTVGPDCIFQRFLKSF